jgi:O-antigen/teichoic acid export membrane protein
LEKNSLRGYSTQLPNLASSAGVGLVGRFGGRLLVVLYGIMAARFLGPEVFGLFAIGLAVFRVMEVLIPLGFDTAIIKYSVGVYRDDVSYFKGVLGFSAGIMLLFSSLLGVLLYLLAPWLSTNIFEKESLEQVFRFVAFSFPLAGLLVLGSSTITVTRGVRRAIAIQDMGQPLLAIALLYVLLALGFGLKGVLFSHLISYGISACIALFFLRFDLFELFKRNVPFAPPPKEYYVFSLVSTAVAILSTLMLWVDRLVLGFYMPAYDIGLYQSVSQLAVIFAVILSGLNRIFIPEFARLQNQGNYQGLHDAYRVGTKWAISIGLPILIFLLVNGKNVLRVLYGNEYVLGANVFLILLIGQFINLITGPVGPLLVIGGYQNVTFLFSGFSLLINILFCLFLIPQFGAPGAASAASLSIAILYLSLFLVAYWKLKVRPFDKRYLKLIVAAVVSYLLAVTLRIIWMPTLLALIAQFLIVSASFLFVLSMMVFEPEDLALFSTFKSLLIKFIGK